MSGIKAIFCDINGVLFEQEERFSTRYSKEFGIPIDMLNSYLDSDFDLCLTGKDDLKARLPKLFETWKWKGTVDELLDYWFGADVPTHGKLIRYINTIRENGLLVFLATQNEKHKTEKFLRALEPIFKYDFVIATYQIEYKKSNPTYYNTCLNTYKLKPDEVVLIDNNIKAINVAKSVGLQTVYFENEAQAISDLTAILNNH